MNYNEYELSLQSGLRIHFSARPVGSLWAAHPYSKQLIALERTRDDMFHIFDYITTKNVHPDSSVK